MKVTEIKYLKRFNDGNYEHTELSVTAQVDGAKEDVTECMADLKKMVYSSHEVVDAKPEVEMEKAEVEEEEEVKPKKSKRKLKVEEPPEEEEEEESEPPVEEAEEEEEEEKPKKKFRSKAATYDRTNELHREIFAGLIKEIDPKWNSTDAKKARAKKVSQLMNGEEFLDAEGEILKTFKAEAKKAFAGK